MSHLDLEQLPIEETEFSVIDFETTGRASINSRAIEIGIVKVKNLKIIDYYSSLINPGFPIPGFITQLTGITNEDIKPAPEFDSIANRISEFLGSSIITAHNLPFDNFFLTNEFKHCELEPPDNRTLCTLKLSRIMFPELKSKSLSSMVKYFGIRHKNIHRALGDATVTAKLLLKLIDKAKDEYHVETIGDLFNLHSKFGTARGYKIIKKQLAEDTAGLPDQPGVYLFKDSKGAVTYIGKGKSLRGRLKNYFTNNAAKKAKKIVRKSNRIEFIQTKSELSALILESELVKDHLPEMNKLLKKYSRQYFIKVNFADEFPVIKSASKFEIDGSDYFGPYPNGDTARALIEISDKAFRLRECSEKEFRKSKKCYLFDIKRCLAPCESKNDVEYNEELIRVYEFLSGNSQGTVDRLLTKMKTLSDQKKYEEAAQIRNIVQAVLKQLNKASILAEPVNKACVLIRIQEGTAPDYILLIEGSVIIKDNANGEINLFYRAVEDFYSGSINISKTLTERDLDRLKICLSWLIKNKHKSRIFYLRDFDNTENFYAAFGDL